MNISLSEIILILFIALLVIKPEQLPEVATALGRFIKLLRHLFKQVTDQVNKLIDHTESSSHEKK